MSHIVMNTETGDFYSESPQLKQEAKRAGMPWNNTCILPQFAKQFTRYKDALKCSQKISDATGAICCVMSQLNTYSDAEKILAQHHEHTMAIEAADQFYEATIATNRMSESAYAH